NQVLNCYYSIYFFLSSRRRHTRSKRDWSSDVCSSDLNDVNKRWEDLVKAARIFNADQGVTPLYQQTTSYMQNTKVKGIIQNTARSEERRVGKELKCRWLP